MTEQDTQQLERLIGKLSDSEKRELADKFLRSLGGDGEPSACRDEMTPEQRQEVVEVLQEVERLPSGDDPYAHLGYSDPTHDRILYDLEQG